MDSRGHERESGFSLLELVVVMMIIAILVVAAVFTYYTTLDRIKLSADVRELNQELQLAKMRAIATGIGHGVAFWRQSDGASETPDAYFVFVDCNNDSIYTDSDGNPANNNPVSSWDNCNSALGYDPNLRGGTKYELNKGNYFVAILGADVKSAGAGILGYVVFNNLGQGVQGTNNLINGNIFMQNHHVKDSSGAPPDLMGVHIIGASGLIDTLPMRKGS